MIVLLIKKTISFKNGFKNKYIAGKKQIYYKLLLPLKKIIL